MSASAFYSLPTKVPVFTSLVLHLRISGRLFLFSVPPKSNLFNQISLCIIISFPVQFHVRSVMDHVYFLPCWLKILALFIFICRGDEQFRMCDEKWFGSVVKNSERITMFWWLVYTNHHSFTHSLTDYSPNQINALVITQSNMEWFVVVCDIYWLSCCVQWWQGDPLRVKVNKLSSTKTQLPYSYYSLPYCRPKRIVDSAENLGEVLRGDRIENSPYVVGLNILGRF